MSRCRASIAMALMAWVCSVNAADKTEALVDVGKERIESERSVQARVDAIGEETGKLEDQYLQVLKTNADLEIYERLLDEQLANQQREIGSIENSISNATLIERQLMPLLTRMVDALGSYIELDLPFLIEERRARVDKLRKLLVRADLTTAEKCRRVLEAYQIENDYGRTIEAYKGRLELADGVFDVEFLRVGRISLTYRDASGSRMGAWNQQAGDWQTLTEGQHRRNLARGLKIARQEMAPELFTVPLAVARETR